MPGPDYPKSIRRLKARRAFLRRKLFDLEADLLEAEQRAREIAYSRQLLIPMPWEKERAHARNTPDQSA